MINIFPDDVKSIHYQEHVNITESHLSVTDYVLWGHCQNLLDNLLVHTKIKTMIKQKCHLDAVFQFPNVKVHSDVSVS